MDTVYIQEQIAILNKKYNAELSLMNKSEGEERMIHYGNTKFIEGQLNILKKLIRLYM